MTSKRDGLGSRVRRIVDVISLAIVGAAVTIGASRFLLAGDAVRDGGPARADLGAFVETASKGHRIGPVDAPALIVVFNDYQCGACRELNGTLEALRRRYPDHLSVVVRHFVNPTLTASIVIPIATECAAAQNRFAEYHSAVFEAGKAAFYRNGWRSLGERATVPDPDAFAACVERRQHMGRITEDYERGKVLGVTVTPTMFVNGIPVVGAMALDRLDSLVALQFQGRAKIHSGSQPD